MNPPRMEPEEFDPVFGVHGAELLLFAFGALVSLAVVAIVIVLLRHARKEERAQVERERRQKITGGDA